MAADRFVYFGPKEEKPTQEELQWFLEDYYGHAATVLWDKDRFFVTFPGTISNAFRRVCVSERTQNHEQRERWIEVWIGDDCVDVMTRQMDQFTSDSANNLQRWISKYWKGTPEDP